MATANCSSKSLFEAPLCPKPVYTPFYHVEKNDLFDSIPDRHLALAAPVLAYWSLSLFFHFLDTRTWKALDKYRIHPSAEVASRNLVSRSAVVYAVIFQHIVQSILGFVWLPAERPIYTPHSIAVQSIANHVQTAFALVGSPNSDVVRGLSQFLYWWVFPALQLLAAMFIIDTWQYFLHRAMHVNKFLYKHFHSWHHRLYVPYAFGSLYNHPVEGFVLDTAGALFAEWATMLTIRQATLLFIISTFKTVDDHCGYSFPWDPLQLMSGNNADYHDIHHQIIGIKSNFAQPFFVHWDALLGTRMTRQDIEERRKAQKAKNQ